MANSAARAATARLTWIDVMKGISILWIAFFHFFRTYANDRFPYPTQDGYFAAFVSRCTDSTPACWLEAVLSGVVFLAFHAVAVFVVLSGFGLTFSLAKTGEPKGGWLGWYRSRLLRLFPMYWLAHVVYLVSPFQSRPEPIDYRFLLSFLGDRVWPIDSIFYYFNPALWYFGLLVELYLAFPILYELLERLGGPAFLALAAAFTIVTLYFVLFVVPMHGFVIQGAFFGCRLWEFALGMALGLLFRRDAAAMTERLFSLRALAAGTVVYGLGLSSYSWPGGHIVTDALTGTGLFVLLAHASRGLALVPALGPGLARLGLLSYGLYLLHQPYVLWFGEWARPLPGPAFLPLAVVLIAVLATVSSEVERRVNALVSRIVPA
jgi:peptidoglycan/LPS O-acetylase OafA/YrhL